MASAVFSSTLHRRRIHTNTRSCEERVNVKPNAKRAAEETVGDGSVLACSVLTAGSRMDPSPLPSPTASSAYYLDCSANQNGNGTDGSPWNSPAAVNAFTFRPGDYLFIKRGTVCKGTLMPQGSGASNAAIVIDTYGTGAQPVINGGSGEEALKLFNQQYWEINNLELTGGTRYGIFISGDTPNSALNHIYLRNLDVHGATYTSSKRATLVKSSSLPMAKLRY